MLGAIAKGGAIGTATGMVGAGLLGVETGPGDFAIAAGGGAVGGPAGGALGGAIGLSVCMSSTGSGGGGGGDDAGGGSGTEPDLTGRKPPVQAVKLRGSQGWRDANGNIWKKDMLHKDHWDVMDRSGNKIREVDFNGRELWPNGPKNRS